MELFDFLSIGIVDVLDILLVALLLYYIYKLIRGTAAINIIIGIIIVYLIARLTKELNMKLLSSILGNLLNVGVIALVVVFQQEIRKFLLMLGSTNFARRSNLSKHFKFLRQDHPLPTFTDIEAIIQACQKMASTKTGAIIVIERNNTLEFIKGTGDQMNIEVSTPIIESIFFKNSPLHDGAAIIQGNKITATRVVLPVSNDRNIPLRFGLRHRAAIGISEKTDALVIVVSEETGEVSYIREGDFILYESYKDLKTMLERDLL